MDQKCPELGTRKEKRSLELSNPCSKTRRKKAPSSVCQENFLEGLDTSSLVGRILKKFTTLQARQAEAHRRQEQYWDHLQQWLKEIHLLLEQATRSMESISTSDSG